jgi:hypothetical protein
MHSAVVAVEGDIGVARVEVCHGDPVIQHYRDPAPTRPLCQEVLRDDPAYVLIQTDVGKAGQVARTAAELDGVQQAQPSAGPYDVVRAEALSIDALGRTGRLPL